MAVRKFMLNIGQSNATPTADALSWWLLHLNLYAKVDPVVVSPLLNAPDAPKGSYADTYTFPSGVFPNHSTVTINGKGVSAIRYLSFWSPQATGYSDYPNKLRLTVISSSSSFQTEQVWVSTMVGQTMVRTRTGTTHTVTGHTNVGGASQVLSFGSAFSPALELGEVFTFEHVAITNGTTTQFTHQLQYGQVWPGSATLKGSLEGCWVRWVSGNHQQNLNQRRQISSISGASNNVITLMTAFPQNITAGDKLVIEPPTGVEWHKWGYFLPWVPIEGEVVSGKENPYPPGLNFPNHYDTPLAYNPYTGNSIAFAVQEGAAYHPGLASRLHEFFGETIYVISLSYGGTSIGHTELSTITDLGLGYQQARGWMDSAQQTYWAPGESNGIFARLMDTFDAAVATAALNGDTLECVGIFFPQGEGDSIGPQASEQYRYNLQRLKTAVRQAIKDRGMYSGAAETIPWVQPNIHYHPTWTYFDRINSAIEAEADADRYMRTCDVTDLLMMPDGVHYNGIGMTQLEAKLFAAWIQARQGIVQDASPLIVEDGIGASNGAETSYASQDFCGVYFQNQGGVTVWNNATEQQRSEALMQATIWIDQNYGTRFVGLRSSSTQPLEWPRAFAYDREGYEITGIPLALKRATAEMARRWLEDKTQFQPDVAAGSNVTQDTVTVGPITISKTYGGGKDSEKRFKVIDRLFQVAGLIDSGGWARR